MWQLNKSFKDPLKTKTSSLVLNPDKSATQHKISYPIVWSGWVGVEMVKIIQIGPAAAQESFVFEVFPKEYVWLQNKIIEWICDYLNIGGSSCRDHQRTDKR